jgi:hypothetical protein
VISPVMLMNANSTMVIARNVLQDVTKLKSITVLVKTTALTKLVSMMARTVSAAQDVMLLG